MTYFDADKHPEMEKPLRRRDEDFADGEVPDISKKDWFVGDRVLAPWGRAQLFPGTIDRVAEAEVYVLFDDGDRGWVVKEQVKPLQLIGVGSRVFCRWRGGKHYYPGTIVQKSGDQIYVKYDDGDEEWSVIGMIAVPSGLPPTLWERVLGLSGYAWIAFIIFLIWRGCS